MPPAPRALTAVPSEGLGEALLPAARDSSFSQLSPVVIATCQGFATPLLRRALDTSARGLSMSRKRGKASRASGSGRLRSSPISLGGAYALLRRFGSRLACRVGRLSRLRLPRLRLGVASRLSSAWFYSFRLFTGAGVACWGVALARGRGAPPRVSRRSRSCAPLAWPLVPAGARPAPGCCGLLVRFGLGSLGASAPFLLASTCAPYGVAKQKPRASRLRPSNSSRGSIVDRLCQR
jgi:hypothetical protein